MTQQEKKHKMSRTDKQAWLFMFVFWTVFMLFPQPKNDLFELFVSFIAAVTATVFVGIIAMAFWPSK